MSSILSFSGYQKLVVLPEKRGVQLDEIIVLLDEIFVLLDKIAVFDRLISVLLHELVAEDILWL